MKSIGIFTDTNSKVAQFLKNNLNEVFQNKVNINNYYINDLKQNDLIKDDIVLFMIKERALKVKKNISPSSKIIVIRRTFLEKEVYKLFSIPDDTDVLVVNDNYETTIETITLFYELGITHLNLIPYQNDKLYNNINVAVTPGEIKFIPKFIKKVVDLGNRYIDISTFFQIISILKLNDEIINKNLIIYSEKIISLDTGIRDNYKDLFVKNIECNTIINLSKNGIILTDNKEIIKLCNQSFKNMFSINKNIEGESINLIFKDKLKEIIKDGEIKDEVIKYKNRYLNINKKYNYYLGVKTGTYYIIQEITYIKQLEQNLSKKIREKGQIAKYTFNDIKTQSSNMLKCIELAKKISYSDLTVIIIGESGTGKELIAQSIHNNSNRKNQPFIAVNCAAMPENLLESELFGYEKGAFTGALKEGKKGLFEQANNGTIFLDEIGDMPVLLQTKLLRVLQEKQVMPIGSQNIININVRIIAATNKNLIEMIKNGQFREDLYYRLNVLPINIPPLRERKNDILSLLKYFLNKELKISKEIKEILLRYFWPGNIRELQNAASYISIMCDKEIKINDLPYNILNSIYNQNKKDNFENEVYFIESKCNFKDLIEVLKIINLFDNFNKSLGRNKIVYNLKENGININESEVRKILNVLKEVEFIKSNIGRAGSKITNKGKMFLNNFI